jgi:hypothetical protein
MAAESPQVLLIGSDGLVEALSALPASEAEWSVAAYRSEWWRGTAYYHRDGRRHTVAHATLLRPLSMAARLLGTAQVKVRQEFASSRYELDDLKSALGAAIKADDDTLTQFRDASELLAALDTAATFDEVVAVVQLTESASDGAD